MYLFVRLNPDTVDAPITLDVPMSMSIDPERPLFVRLGLDDDGRGGFLFLFLFGRRCCCCRRRRLLLLLLLLLLLSLMLMLPRAFRVDLVLALRGDQVPRHAIPRLGVALGDITVRPPAPGCGSVPDLFPQRLGL